jgi:NAD(P)-dependent dehydrogenase (short-subunit alcohol dehydrogenase family)
VEFKGLFDLSGRVAVVTGAGSGLGQAIALAFGAKIVSVDSNLNGATETAQQVQCKNGEAFGFPARFASRTQN